VFRRFPAENPEAELAKTIYVARFHRYQKRQSTGALQNVAAVSSATCLLSQAKFASL
jgi:hypothetical protein